ncbi:MMS19 nucleotide excision repair protein [Anticarsia gemmatalis]|uniref:MMS19 nucleotide excision repair protein n=1 Tax=Anticarsia gemmatalis TaxID=129554 RepID=UPI003F762493
MDSVWFKPELAEAIMKDNDIFEQIPSVVTDIITGHVDLTQVVENMSAVLTHKEPENREKGMRYYTQLLQELPNNYLTEMQIRFISKFYTDRLKDHHSVIPSVLAGYLVLMNMKNYNVSHSADFLATMYREVSCQSQLRQDRYNIYMIINKLLDLDAEYCKSLGSDFVYGVISAMEGERDPRNLLFLFNFLPKLLHTVSIGHLVDEMFDVISCYFPIDFTPTANDPVTVTRDDLAAALGPCMYALPEFGEQCVVLLIEKLDSNLRVAKIDSLRLLADSCSTFTGATYGPFLKALGSSLNREINNKSDDEIRMASHKALSALVAKLATIANTDQSFETLIKNILIVNQKAIAEATTVSQFVQATKVLLTTANASKESCVVITRCMVPAMISYYEFKTSHRLQIASLDFVGDLYDIVKHWEVEDLVKAQVSEIPQLCLTAVSNPGKDFQISGFKTLIRVKNVLKSDLVLAFVEILIHNIHHSQDTEILGVSVEAIHAIARKHPELIMSLVVKGKCNLDNLMQDKTDLQKRLHLLTNLASIDEFTKVIIEDILKIITAYDKETNLVVEALSESMSMASFYTTEKVVQIESDHGLIDPILTWLFKEIPTSSQDTLVHGYTLISNTISSLPPEKQQNILSKHTSQVLEKCKANDVYFLVLESLYSPLHQKVYSTSFEEILTLSLKVALNSENDLVRTKACVLVAHLLNKAEHGQQFELLYEVLKNQLSACSRHDEALCPRLLLLYGWLTKALIFRGSDMFVFWLHKIVRTLPKAEYSKNASESIRIIMTDFPEYLSSKQHCRTSILYKQRMFETFCSLMEKIDEPTSETKEDYLLSWAYVLAKTPSVILNSNANKITPILIDALVHDNKDLLLSALDVLCQLIKSQPIAESLQTVLPRLINLTKYVKSMDVRIKSLECLYNIANTFRTSLLLPFKQDILLDLAPSLDDKKRLVRNMAVRARTRWFLVGAPGEDKNN